MRNIPPCTGKINYFFGHFMLIYIGIGVFLLLLLSRVAIYR